MRILTINNRDFAKVIRWLATDPDTEIIDTTEHFELTADDLEELAALDATVDEDTAD